MFVIGRLERVAEPALTGASRLRSYWHIQGLPVSESQADLL